MEKDEALSNERRTMDGHGPIEVLVRALDLAYDHKAWQGATLRGCLRLVQPDQAAWRPAPGRHSIHDLVVHAAYWKYTVWRRLTGAPRGSFPLPGSDWFVRREEDWRDDLSLLDRMHAALRAAVVATEPAQLGQPAPGGQDTVLDLIAGITAHDIYHTGQIQLLKRLYATR